MRRPGWVLTGRRQVAVHASPGETLAASSACSARPKVPQGLRRRLGDPGLAPGPLVVRSRGTPWNAPPRPAPPRPAPPLMAPARPEPPAITLGVRTAGTATLPGQYP